METWDWQVEKTHKKNYVIFQFCTIKCVCNYSVSTMDRPMHTGGFKKSHMVCKQTTPYENCNQRTNSKKIRRKTRGRRVKPGTLVVDGGKQRGKVRDRIDVKVKKENEDRWSAQWGSEKDCFTSSTQPECMLGIFAEAKRWRVGW